MCIRDRACTVGSTGLGVLVNLGKLVSTLYGALAVFTVVVLWPIAKLFRVPIARFLSAVAEPATIGFATSSSEAALPTAMERMEALGVPRRIVAFVIPTGYSFNPVGSTLYMACLLYTSRPSLRPALPAFTGCCVLQFHRRTVLPFQGAVSYGSSGGQPSPCGVLRPPARPVGQALPDAHRAPCFPRLPPANPPGSHRVLRPLAFRLRPTSGPSSSINPGYTGGQLSRLSPGVASSGCYQD